MLEKVINKIGLSSFQLKIIAIISMTIDHTGLMLMGGTKYYALFRIIGRMAFPIYCFLLAEGYQKTSNVKKYALRLFVFALISEIPFNLMVTGKVFSLGYQNVFFTLFLGLAMMYWYTWFSSKNKHTAALLGVPLFMAAAYLLHTDYSWWGIIVVFIFYAFRDRKLFMAVFEGAAMILYGGTEKYAVASLAPILLYNGKKGRSMKYFFYAYYPIHIVILCIIKYLIIR